MTADRDQHGLTRDQIAGQLDLLGDDETHERHDQPASGDTTED